MRVGILEHEIPYWPEIPQLIEGVHSELVHIRRRYRDLPSLSVQMLRRYRGGVPLGIALSVSHVLRRKIELLLATDGGHRELVTAFSKMAPEIPLYLISHGSVRVDSIRAAVPLPISHATRVLLWGSADLETYARAGIPLPHSIIVGSLRNAFYWRNHRSNKGTPELRYPLSLVSNFSIGKEDSPSLPCRSRVLRSMKLYLARYCRERKLPLRVLLRPGVSGELTPSITINEIQHFERMFEGVALTFSDVTQRYATYLDSDASDVTVGIPSGSLTESFARGNKVLMFGQNPASGDMFGFPRTGLFLLTEPSYAEFSSRLDEIRAISVKEFASQFMRVRQEMVHNATSESPIADTQRLILNSGIPNHTLQD